MATNCPIELSDVRVAFGGVTSLQKVDFNVREFEIRGLIGPNGAGKTTLLNTICGLVRPVCGVGNIGGVPINEVQPMNLARMRLMRTYQNLVLLNEATVAQNVSLGLVSQFSNALLNDLFFLRRRLLDMRKNVQATEKILHKLGIQELSSRRVSELSYGQKKMVELARSLISEPKILLLDEPTAGLSEAEIVNLKTILKNIHTEHPTTTVVITHHISFLKNYADSVTVLNLGNVIAEGSVESVAANPDVIEAYFGSST